MRPVISLTGTRLGPELIWFWGSNSALDQCFVFSKQDLRTCKKSIWGLGLVAFVDRESPYLVVASWKD